MVDRSDTNPLSRYPRTLHLGGLAVVLRLASPDDAALVLDLAVRQPADDLLHLRRDLTRPEEVEAWLDRADRGQMAILVAQSGDGLAGWRATPASTAATRAGPRMYARSGSWSTQHTAAAAWGARWAGGAVAGLRARRAQDLGADAS